MARVVGLSTEDNPFNPLEQFDEWYAYDLSLGYDTAGYLARIAKVSDEMPPYYYRKAVEEAVDEIVELNLSGKYIKVVGEEDDD